MPLTSSATDAIGIVTLVLVILLCIIGATCLASVLYFHSKVRKEQQLALRDFDSPWIVRLVLVAIAVLWSLGELLRLPLLRTSGWLLHGLSFTGQANLCRLHTVFSIGLLEPGFFLTVLFLVHGCLHTGPFTPRSLSGRVFTFMIIFCLPVFLLHFLLLIISSSFQFHKAYSEADEGFGGSIPSYFTRFFEKVQDGSGRSVALCTYPLMSVLLLGLFGFIFVLYFSFLGMKMLRLVINRKLQKRVYGLVFVVVVLLPLHVVFLGFSVRVKPSETAHEVLVFMGFLTVVLCTTIGEGILVFRPIADALAVCFILQNRYKRWQSFNTSPMEPFGRSVSAFVSDDEDLSSHVARLSLLENTVSIAGTDTESSSKEVSLSFDTMLKEVTQRPGSQVVEIMGPFPSPGSPALPGKPMISLPDKCNV